MLKPRVHPGKPAEGAVATTLGGRETASPPRIATAEEQRPCRQRGFAPGHVAIDPNTTAPAASRGKAGLVRCIRGIIVAQRIRSRCLGAELFSDPCWGLLLELFLAREEGREMLASSAGISAGIPPATAHRWLKKLEAAGLVVRRSDAHDRRRVLVELSEQAIAGMGAYLERAYLPVPTARGGM